MTRGRIVWYAMLAVGLVVALLLRAPKRERAPSSEPAPRAVSPRTSGNSDDFVEIEVADPRELGVTPRAPSSVGVPPPGNEAELVSSLAATWQSEPERALALAADADARFGESPRAVERRLYEIKALVALGRIGRARSKAERYLALYPPGPMTDEVERLTGVHRRPPP